MGESIPGFTGHAYDQIVKRNKNAFLNHPEYFAQTIEKGNIPKNPKFDISNSDLVNLVIKDALSQAKLYSKKYGPEFMISMDPSDGGGYCKKPACSKWLSESDQVYYLANEVAKRLKFEYPKAYIGLYAYYLHSAPPSFDLEDNIVIYIATSFNQSKYSYDELISQWNQNVNYIGIRDYYGVINWDWDLPGQGKGTKPIQIHGSINDYYSNDARYYYIESLNGWITKGLGHFIAARTLWDLSIDPKKEIDEFYSLMFSQTQKIMQPLLEDLMKYSREKPIDKDLQLWIEKLDLAYQNVTSPNEKKRIEDVMEYLYSVILFTRRNKSNPDSFKHLYKFYHQANDNSNYATYAMRRMLLDDFKNLMPETIISTRTSAINYKSTTPIDYIKGLDSIQQILNPIHWSPFELDYDKLEFNEITIGGTRSSKSEKPIMFRENHLFLIDVMNKSKLGINTGLVNYKNKREGLIELYAYDDIDLVAPINKIRIIPDSTTQVSMNNISPGKYWLKMSDNRGGFNFSNITNMRIAIYQDKAHPLNTFHRNIFYFYVPEGVSQFVIRKKGAATIISPSGKVIDLESYGNSNVNIEVQENDRGYWKVEKQKGTFFIEGIPPFFANNKEDLPSFARGKKCFLFFWK